MNGREKKLALMSREQMGEEEYHRIKVLTGKIKRIADLFTCIPGATEAFEADTPAFLKQYGLEDLDPEEMRLIFLTERQEEKKKMFTSDNVLDLIPESMYRYAQFVQNKLYFRDFLRDKGCVPANRKAAVWRERNNKRCDSALGGVNISFIHAILTIELAKGCSVGCEFCGLSAEKLTKLYRYNEENAKLFEEVLTVLKDVLGQAAAYGMMYFATEPLDNPDYEKFEDIYYNVFGMIPQITTAVFDRNIERTRALVHELDERPGFIHRFSLRNLAMAETALREFTPEELVNVELITQYEDSPYFLPYTVVGSEREHVGERQKGPHTRRIMDEALADSLDAPVLQNEIRRMKDLKHVDPGTICCVDGFRINMCDRTIRILTPCHMSEKYPNGISETPAVSFTDGEDFRLKLNQMIDEYMLADIPKNEILKCYNYLNLEESDEGIMLVSSQSGYRLPLGKLGRNPMEETLVNPAVKVVEKLMENRYTKDQIVRSLMEEYGIAPANLYWLLNQFWKQGLIVDSRFF